MGFWFRSRSKKNRFSRWWPSWTSHQNNFSFFDLQHVQVTLMLPTKFQVNWPFGSGEERKNTLDFSRLPPCQPSWISDWNNCSFFLIYKSPRCFLPSSNSTGLSVQEKKKKIDFQEGHHGSHLECPIGMILTVFDLQAILMLSTKIKVNWPFGSEEAKDRFSRWPPWRPSWWPSWISVRNNLNYFWYTSHPNASSQVSSQLAFQFRSRSKKYIFKMAATMAILGFQSEQF